MTMLTDLVDLALNGLVTMWILSLGYIVYTAWTDRGQLAEEHAEVAHLELASPEPVLRSA